MVTMVKEWTGSLTTIALITSAMLIAFATAL